jgi:hypothetical protein
VVLREQHLAVLRFIDGNGGTANEGVLDNEFGGSVRSIAAELTRDGYLTRHETTLHETDSAETARNAPSTRHYLFADGCRPRRGSQMKRAGQASSPPRCEECFQPWHADDHSRWRAFWIDDGPDERLVFYCPECAEREFGSD